MDILKFQNLAIQLICIFFFGMIGQFLAHTIVMYGLNLPSYLEFIRLWKEVIIGILGIGALSIFRKYEFYKNKILENKNILLIVGTIMVSFVISLLNSIVIHDQNIITFLVSAKFNYIPLIIFSCGLFISQIITSIQYNKVINIIITTIKYVLIFSVIWYCIIHTIPNILDRIGFAQPGDSIERTANNAPPSLYLTEFYSGYVRNQGPFGGPLSLGFYLVVFWPLFFVKLLYKKRLSDTRGRRLLYISMVLSTYSRAAWGMFFVSSLLIGLIMYKQYTKYIIGGALTVLIGIFMYIIGGGNSEIFIRTWSDKGHIEFFQQGLELVKKYWLWGIGAASVGPGANHIEGINEVFNPENQYMQIWLEYGFLGLLLWLLSYIFIAKNSIKKWLHIRINQVEYNSDDIIFIGIGISIISLTIGGMVLHPFTDSSSMYPFMLFAGLVIGEYSFKKPEMQNIRKDIVTNTIFLSGRKVRTILVSLLFTIQTLLVSGLNIIDNIIIISTVRDLLFSGIIIRTVGYGRNHLISFIKKYYIIITLSILLFLINILYIIDHINEDILHIIAGIKYDIYFVIIMIVSIRFGYILKKKNKGHLISSYIKWFGKFILTLVIGGVIRQITKTIYPELFIKYMGFSMPNDFIPFSKPPIYYITGSGGIQRLSGLFVGPNTLGFFLILFTNVIYYQYKHILIQRKNRRMIISYMLIAISTMSRGVIIGVTIQFMILLFFENYIIGQKKISDLINMKHKIIIGCTIIVVSILSFLGINQRKQDSNSERLGALNSSLALMGKVSFLGNGPGYVGPAKHYDKDYNLDKKNNLSMLENIYLQIVINQGVLGFLIFTGIIIILLYYHNTIRIKLENKNITNKQKDYDIYLTVQYLGIGLVSLLAIGWFLHIFIDSMVNYLFFIIYGIGLGYTTSNQYE